MSTRGSTIPDTDDGRPRSAGGPTPELVSQAWQRGRLHDQMEHWAAERPDGEFAVHGSRQLTWREAAEWTDQLGTVLIELGLPVGARVAVLARNSIEYVLLYYAAAKAGVVLVPLNPRSAPSEWAHVVADSGAAMVVSDAAHVAAVDRLDRPTAPRCATLDGTRTTEWTVLADLVAAAPPGAPARMVRAEDDLYQLYTSGTTGRPKGAVLTHRAVTANCAQIAAMPHAGPAGERTLVVAPLCHAGIVWSAFAPQLWGASLYFLSDFDPPELVRTLSEQRIGYAALVPSMLQMCLAEVPDIVGQSFRSLRLIHTGSAPISEPTLRAANERFGCDVVVGYGMTEASAGTSVMTPSDVRRALTTQPALLRSVGRPLPGTDVRIVGPAGDPLRVGEVGEIVVRGPQLMRGYWRAPSSTAESVRGGWLHTGDAGFLDPEGYLHITDRIKDVIISGGINVYPRQIEDVLHAHPAVAEAAVIGVPHERWGETVKAVVVPRPAAVVDEGELLAFCRERLGGPQRPRSVDVVDTLPRTASGKVRKRDLRTPYWAGQQRQVAGP